MLYIQKNTPTINSSIGGIPTSTSAPTPTSIYKSHAQQAEVDPAKTKTVTLTANGFSPQVLTITKGTTVLWENDSGELATVNSDPHPIHTAYPPLNLGQFNNGDTLSLKFNKPGRYGYHNHLDATQTGTIIVQ